jgi:hypothetical protein
VALMLPRVGLQPMQNNLSATPSSTLPGTTVTASATPHTKGAWAQMFASTNFPVCGITLTIANDATSTDSVKNLYDLGTGGSGSEVPIVSNIFNTAAAIQTGLSSYYLPIFIPKGTRISCRKQSATGSKTGSVFAFLHGGWSSPPDGMFAGAEGIGVNLATSGGLDHAAGSSGVESSWENIGSPLARTYGAIFPTVGMGSDLDMLSQIGHLEIGIGGVVLGETLFATNSAESIVRNIPNVPILGRFPAGSQLQVRAEMSSTADTSVGVALLGLY